MIDWNGIDRRLIALASHVDWDHPEVQDVLRSIPACTDPSITRGTPVVFTDQDGVRRAGVVMSMYPNRGEVRDRWAAVAYVDRNGVLAQDRLAPAYYILRRHTPHKADELWDAKYG
jgi:hypothetical protein